jgi:membrane protease YdiL (CAAX protease family)
MKESANEDIKHALFLFTIGLPFILIALAHALAEEFVGRHFYYQKRSWEKDFKWWTAKAKKETEGE